MPFIRVSLEFVKQYDPELIRRIPDYDGLIRLVGLVTFRSSSGWTDPIDAIIDTGAHTSILPRWLWKTIEKKEIGKYYVRGLVPDPECQMNVDIAWVTGTLLDQAGNKTEEIRFRAYLAPTNEIPIVLGFKDLLEKYKICFDFNRRSGYLESGDLTYRQRSP